MMEIDNYLKLYKALEEEDSTDLNEITPSPTLEEIRAKLPSHLADLADVFNRQEAKQLPKHGLQDYKIELYTPLESLPKNKLRNIRWYKL